MGAFTEYVIPLQNKHKKFNWINGKIIVWGCWKWTIRWETMWIVVLYEMCLQRNVTNRQKSISIFWAVNRFLSNVNVSCSCYSHHFEPWLLAGVITTATHMIFIVHSDFNYTKNITYSFSCFDAVFAARILYDFRSSLSVSFFLNLHKCRLWNKGMNNILMIITTFIYVHEFCILYFVVYILFRRRISEKFDPDCVKLLCSWSGKNIFLVCDALSKFNWTKFYGVSYKDSFKLMSINISFWDFRKDLLSWIHM